MRALYIIALVILVFSTSAEAVTEHYYMDNNTGLNFMNGYYQIEVFEVNKLDAFAKVNITSEGQSRIYHLWSGEDTDINTAPFNRITNINASFFTENSFRLTVEYPANWSAPERYNADVKTVTEAILSSKAPNLVIIKTADKTNVNIGEVVEFKITVKNEGNASANNITLTEFLPDGFTRAPGSRFPPDVKEKLDPDETDIVFYALKAIESGSFRVEPTTLNYGSKTNTSNSLTINIAKEIKEKSNLVTTVEIDDNDLLVGDRVNIKITITNTGKVPAESILIDGKTPDGMEVVDGDLRQVYKKLDSEESEIYTATLKAVEAGNYSLRIKTIYNDDAAGYNTDSESITVVNKEKNYLYIIVPMIGIVIGIILFTMRKHKEYRF